MEDMIYVAVGQVVKECKAVLVWALQNSGGNRICILHVHQPAHLIPVMGGKFPASSVTETIVKEYRETERQNMQKILDDYMLICRQMGVRAEKLHTEMDCIEKGIVELISQNGIRKLVMGAAADKKMMELKSNKAKYVREQAPLSCHIQFVCKGLLIHTREASVDAETGQSNHLRSRSINVALGHNWENSETTKLNYLRSRSISVLEHNRNNSGKSSLDIFLPVGTKELPSPNSRMDTEWSPPGSGYPTCSSSRMVDVTLSPWTEGNENGLESSGLSQSSGHLRSSTAVEVASSLLLQQSPTLIANSSTQPTCSSSWVPNEVDMSIDDSLYVQLQQVMVEAENAKRDAFEETVRRRKAEREVIEAKRRAKASEALYAEEVKQRREIEEGLTKEKVENEKLKHWLNQVMREFRIALDQKTLLESQIAESHQMINGLELRILSATELLQTYRKERDELQMERDNALKEAEELRRKQGEASSRDMPPRFFSEFSFSEIQEATRNFDQSLKIGGGGYGSVYKGLLHNVKVAIKTLQSVSSQGPSEFQMEVRVLSKFEHPNLVRLIGSCSEAWALIYEYLPNGSLEDRLIRKDNTPPLSWQTRIRIAAELCSVLAFLHSGAAEPHSQSIVHGDLKPSNILLDANFVSKLSDFGICRILVRDISSSNDTTLFHRTDAKGSFAYMDPEFQHTGVLTVKSDVYSFGIILLQLLIGKPAFGIKKGVQNALDAGNLKALFDPSAGDWPFVQAEQLVRLALRCCDMYRRNRPDLGSEVCVVLEPMRASFGYLRTAWC